MTEEPISLWMDELREADPGAAEKLWNHFFERLLVAAGGMLDPRVRRVYNEEDAALSAFHSVCVGFAAGRYPNLNDRESLWRMLLVITSRKVARRRRHERQQRRDVRRIVANHVFVDHGDGSVAQGVQHAISREPTPEFTVAFAETCEVFFDHLGEPQLQQVAALRMEGHNDSEIAKQIGCSRSTVQRRLEIIRRQCQRLDEPV